MGNRKLLVGEKVEVSFPEEGLKGSWHEGKVIRSSELGRFVECAELYSDDGRSKHLEYIAVSLAVEGLVSELPENYRGNIRPLPPRHSVDVSEIRYGMCVDARFDDAWWEGVVFDREEGSQDRLIFFPDLGDQHFISINQLRFTFDWNEVSGVWKARGEWVVLKLLDELVKEEPLPVSIRQIWYDISSMDIFYQKIGEWIFGSPSLWHSLLLEVITGIFSVVQGQHVMSLVPFSESISSKSAQEKKSVLPNEIKGLTTSERLTSLSSDDLQTLPGIILKHSNETKQHMFLKTPTRVEAFAMCFPNEESVTQGHSMPLNIITEQNHNRLPQSYEETRRQDVRSANFFLSHQIDNPYHFNNEDQLVENDDLCSGIIEKSSMTGIQCSNVVKEIENGTSFQLGVWRRIQIPAKYDPDAIINLCKSTNTKINSSESWRSAREHLAALGWKIYLKKDTSKSSGKRYQYISPNGLKFHSLSSICCYLTKSELCHQAKSPVEARSEVIVPENCPDAIKDYVSLMEEKSSAHSTEAVHGIIKKGILKAKSHLLHSGWTLFFIEKNGKPELRYKSPFPGQKIFTSLLTACKSLLGKKDDNECSTAIAIGASDKAINGSQPRECSHKLRIRYEDMEVNCNTPCEYLGKLGGRSRSNVSFFQNGTQAGEQRTKKLSKRKVENSLSVEDSDAAASLMLICSSDHQRKRHKRPNKVARKCAPEGNRCKRSLDISPLSPAHHIPCTILSWLIDNDSVLPRQKVRYISKEDGLVVKEGRISRGGISCKCCLKFYTLANFEIHAGGNGSHPAARIFLHDGRSLWDCQRMIVENKRTKQLLDKRKKGNSSYDQNDSICSICQDGGDLILCDSCPSCFHINCIGLKDVPEGDWFCSSCKCSTCGLGKLKNGHDKFSENPSLFCDQCESEYHAGCVSDFGLERLTAYSGSWLCSQSCLKIFSHLQSIVGRRNPTSVDGISWTLLRSQVNTTDNDIFSNDSWIEHHSKLFLALDVLHECFVSLVEPHTKTDLIEDLLFNKRSELRRLNFSGFYTLLLEKEDELISVATLRVLGEKVAEMPFVGTRFQYRRRGMCRLLMDELEKLLHSMGVERLFLPAVPQLLQTWKNSFGFSEMTHSDRLSLSKFTFLTFQGSKMCHKLLKLSDATSNESTRNANEVKESIICCNNDMDHYCNSSLSKVLKRCSYSLERPTASGMLPISCSDGARDVYNQKRETTFTSPSGSLLCI